VPEPPVEAAGGLLPVEIEQEIGGGGEERRVAVENGLVDGILRDHRLAQALRADEDEILDVAEEIEAEDALDQRPVDRLRPGPVEIGHGLEAAEAGALEAAFEAPARAVLQFGAREGFEQRDRGPAVLRRAGQQVIEILGDAREAEPAEVMTQGSRVGSGLRAS
jgi:hypothetical protein